MAIYFSTENIDFTLPSQEKVKKWVTHIVKMQGKRVGEINYLFCDDAYLIEVNRTYLNHDTYTDIGRYLHQHRTCKGECPPIRYSF